MLCKEFIIDAYQLFLARAKLSQELVGDSDLTTLLVGQMQFC